MEVTGDRTHPWRIAVGLISALSSVLRFVSYYTGCRLASVLVDMALAVSIRVARIGWEYACRAKEMIICRYDHMTIRVMEAILWQYDYIDRDLRGRATLTRDNQMFMGSPWGSYEATPVDKVLEIRWSYHIVDSHSRPWSTMVDHGRL